ncbi:MAG: hypothetical protein ACJ8AT_34110 [Hyalangium sp.]|uniref:hypothetical protein n=1 Tax=Hyalangium sp. TaxID=2028555 RepID=UPI00389AD1FF
MSKSKAPRFLPVLFAVYFLLPLSVEAQTTNESLIYVGTSDPDDNAAVERCREKFYPSVSYKEGALAGFYVPLPVVVWFRDKQIRYGSGISYDLEWRFVRPHCSSLGRMTLRAKPEDGLQIGLVFTAAPLIESTTENTQTRVDVVTTDPQTGQPITTSQTSSSSDIRANPIFSLGTGVKLTYNFKTDAGIRRLSLGAYLGWQLNMSTGTGSLFAGPIITIK